MASATASSSSSAALKRRVKRNTRTLPAIITVVAVAGLGWFGWAKTHPPADPNAKLLTAPVTRGDLLETISATGSITAQTGARVNIGSQITGTIKRLYADIGSYVKAGDKIAELDLPDLQAQVNQQKANLEQAKINAITAQTKLDQQRNTLRMVDAQTNSALAQAKAAYSAAEARLSSAGAVASQQSAQTPEDINRAQTALDVSKAALSTAQAALQQTQASKNLQIATANEDLAQAKANYANSSITLKRNQDLLAKGFVAQSVVDSAQAQASVDSSKIASAQQNVQLVTEKVAADLTTAENAVAQAKQNVLAAEASLKAAKSGTYTVAARNADRVTAEAQKGQAQADLITAQANLQQIEIKRQDVRQAEEALSVARQAIVVAQAQLDYQNAQFAKTIIRTPITGTVLQLAQQQGETLAAGLSAPTLIVVADLNRLQVDAYVDETDIGKVKLGQEAEITVDAFPKSPFRGRVVKIASGSTIQQGVITYDVTLSIIPGSAGHSGSKRAGTGDAAAPEGTMTDGKMSGGKMADGKMADGKMADGKMADGKMADAGSDGKMGHKGAPNDTGAGDGAGAAPGAGAPGATKARKHRDITKLLKPDMTASVVLETGKRTDVLLVPSESVKVGAKGATVNVLEIVDGKKEPKPRPVKTGGSDGVNTEITDGVKEGDIIVRAGLQDPNRRGMGPSSPFGPSNKGGGGGKKGM